MRREYVPVPPTPTSVTHFKTLPPVIAGGSGREGKWDKWREFPTDKKRGKRRYEILREERSGRKARHLHSS